jgi:hypothetical protein
MADRPPIRRTLADHGFAPHRHGYGLLLILILCSLIFQIATTGGELVHVITVILQGGTFLAALWISQARTRLLRIGSVIVVVVTITSAVTFAAAGELDEAGARITSLVLAVLAPVAIVHGLISLFREQGRVTVQTMFGVLCVYLLIGLMFAFVYGLIDEIAAGPMFAQVNHGTSSDYLYFSFVTQTTTGYGDLTAGTDLGRSFAITEALIGQIYMVTVVALIVANLRRPPGQARTGR